MAAWLKVNRPNIEVGSNFVLYQSAIIDLDQATGFAIQSAGSVSFFINGKTFTVQKQFDERGYTQILKYAQHKSGKELGS